MTRPSAAEPSTARTLTLTGGGPGGPGGAGEARRARRGTAPARDAERDQGGAQALAEDGLGRLLADEHRRSREGGTRGGARGDADDVEGVIARAGEQADVV